MNQLPYPSLRCPSALFSSLPPMFVHVSEYVRDKRCCLFSGSTWDKACFTCSSPQIYQCISRRHTQSVCMWEEKGSCSRLGKFSRKYLFRSAFDSYWSIHPISSLSSLFSLLSSSRDRIRTSINVLGDAYGAGKRDFCAHSVRTWDQSSWLLQSLCLWISFSSSSQNSTHVQPFDPIWSTFDPHSKPKPLSLFSQELFTISLKTNWKNMMQNMSASYKNSLAGISEFPRLSFEAAVVALIQKANTRWRWRRRRKNLSQQTHKVEIVIKYPVSTPRFIVSLSERKRGEEEGMNWSSFHLIIISVPLALFRPSHTEKVLKHTSQLSVSQLGYRSEM